MIGARRTALSFRDRDCAHPAVTAGGDLEVAMASTGHTAGSLPSPGQPAALAARGAAGFVWASWALAVSAALGLVLVFGSNVPYWDDWDMVPVLTGEQPVTLSYLWSQHNEHRLLLPRLALLGLLRLTGWDFRSGMVANVLLLGLLALGMIATARRVRGRMIYGDAFFPVVLLHWGHCCIGDIVRICSGAGKSSSCSPPCWRVSCFSSSCAAGPA